MVQVKTFKGYNQQGEVLSTVTAENANNYINPDEVKAAIDNVETVAKNGFENVKKALRNVEPDASEAIVVQGTKMTETIEETGNSLDSFPGLFKESISVLHTESIKVHDQIQTEFNNQARESAKVADVVNVREA